MHPDERAGWYGRQDYRTELERLARGALDYLRSRRREHWLMFCAGLAIGLILG